MNPYQVSQDSIWHRWVDGLVILVIGIAAGVVLSQGLMYEEVTITETVRQVQTVPQVESGVSTDVPSGIKVDEI